MPMEALLLFGCVGLFLKFVDGAVGRFVFIMPKRLASSMGTVRHGNGAVCAGFFVSSQHGGVVHTVDMVAGENEYIVGVKRSIKGMFW